MSGVTHKLARLVFVAGVFVAGLLSCIYGLMKFLKSSGASSDALMLVALLWGVIAKVFGVIDLVHLLERKHFAEDVPFLAAMPMIWMMCALYHAGIWIISLKKPGANNA